MRSWNGSIIGLNEYAHATWLTSPNQDISLVIFLGLGKPDIAFSRLSQGVTPEDVIWRPPELDYFLEELEFFSVEEDYVLLAQ